MLLTSHERLAIGFNLLVAQADLCFATGMQAAQNAFL